MPKRKAKNAKTRSWMRWAWVSQTYGDGLQVDCRNVLALSAGIKSDRIVPADGFRVRITEILPKRRGNRGPR